MRILQILIIASNLVALQAIADTREFVASYEDSAWNYSGSLLECSLTHTIPGYGMVEFRQHAGEIEEGSLQLSYDRSIKATLGEVFFGKPSLRPHEKVKDGWEFQFGKYRDPIVFSPRQVRQIFDNLNSGFVPTITHVDNTDRTVQVYALISPIMFQLAYDNYAGCVANMIPVSWAEISRSNVYFESGSIRLDEKTKQWLNYIIEYARDPAVRRIELGGYTDSVGNFRDNHELAASRIEMVRNYLVNAGFDERKLRLKVYAEQRPVSNNNFSQGRSKNRRVEIKMYR
jgi:outer membrane protein OmpA-like peptidoglycan-associated protein